MNNQGVYQVGVIVKPDLLDGTRPGFVASVTNGHPKVRHLFAFGETTNQARVKLARTIADVLTNSNYKLTGTTKIALIVPKIYEYDLGDLTGGETGKD